MFTKDDNHDIKSFEEWLTKVQYPFPKNPCKEIPMPAHKGDVAVQAIKGRKFFLGSLDKETGKISFADTPVYHDDQVSAVKEANRLTALNPGKLYIVVQYRVGVETPKVTIPTYY